MEQSLINRIVEAALLAAAQPLTLAQLYGLFPEEQPAPADSIEKALAQLRDDCAGRGIELIEVASGFRFQIRQDVHAWVTRLWTERQTRYTRATLETLALIAYRQPITRGEIEQIRGVAVNSNIIKMLEEREWIRVVGHRDVPGKPALFGTTRAFLDYFNLRSLDQLPPLAELHDIPELEPQLDLDARIENGVDVVIPDSIPATAMLDDDDTLTDADVDSDAENDAVDRTVEPTTDAMTSGDAAVLADTDPSDSTPDRAADADATEHTA